MPEEAADVQRLAVNLLIVEDDAADAERLRALALQSQALDARTERTDSLADTLALLDERADFDVVLLDLRLPDAVDRPVFDSVRDATASPIVVLTGFVDDNLGSEYMLAGADDYLGKDELTPHVLARAIRHAVERRALREEIAKAARQREIDVVTRYAEGNPTPVGQLIFGGQPLRESLPDAFGELVLEFAEIVELRLEEVAHGSERPTQPRLRALAEQLGFLNAGPRDVVGLFTESVKALTSEGAMERAQSVVSEGRMLLLEIMGLLLGYYRRYALVSGRRLRMPEALEDPGDARRLSERMSPAGPEGAGRGNDIRPDSHRETP